MEFYKLQATGNDFILTFDEIDESKVSLYCNRNFGIGGDGLIHLHENQIKIYNADGSKAKMCGNGMRCVCKLLTYLTNKNEHKVYIEHDEIKLTQVDDDTAYVLMPLPSMIQYLKGYYVSLLNYHYILITNNLKQCVFDESLIQLSNQKKCNIHFVEIINKRQVKMKTYEYGVYETKSCGSGAMAVFFSLYMLDKVENSIEVLQQGGKVKCFMKNQQYFLQGEVKLLYKGEIINGI